MVGDQDGGGRRRVGGESGQAGDEGLAAAEVEAGHGLIEQHQPRLRVVGASEQDARALARRERAERARGEVADSHPVEGGGRRCPVIVVVGVPPRLEGGVGGGHDHLGGGEAGPEAVGEGGRGQPDAAAVPADVDPPEDAAEHLDLAGAGV